MRQPNHTLPAFLNLYDGLTYKTRNKNKNFKEEYSADTDIRHVVSICCYKEPVELITRTVKSLSDQTEAGRISMVISFEEKTPDVKNKCIKLKQTFENSGFERLIFTIHPFGRSDEIPGKCSNANYSLRKAVQILIR